MDTKTRTTLLAFGVSALLAVSAAAPQAQHALQHRNPKLFDPLDLGFFEQPDRDQWQKPDQIMDALHIADSDVVAEIGAGGGWFTIRLSRRVGQNGVVFAEDIQPAVFEALRRRVQNEGLRNVQTVLGTATDPKLPDGRLDAALIVDVFHEMEDPVALLTNVARALKPQGCLGVVDFSAGEGGPGPDSGERADPEIVIRTATTAGLKLNKREALPPFQYFLVFGNTDSACR